MRIDSTFRVGIGCASTSPQRLPCGGSAVLAAALGRSVSSSEAEAQPQFADALESPSGAPPRSATVTSQHLDAQFEKMFKVGQELQAQIGITDAKLHDLKTDHSRLASTVAGIRGSKPSRASANLS